jgi:release factor glutamine methyltransferase
VEMLSDQQNLPAEPSIEVWTLGRVLASSAKWLSERSQDKDAANFRLEAELLLAHVLKCDRMKLFLQLDKPLSKNEREEFKLLLRRRSDGEPVAYLLSYRDFYRHRFFVDRRVLVPRPDTEALVEVAINHIQTISQNQLFHGAVISVLDVGAGSGCVGISLALACPNVQVVGWDLSSDALDVAKKNADDLTCKNIRFETCDLMTAVNSEQYDVIVSNPPYIRSSERAELSVSVREFEPGMALFDPHHKDGLTFFRKLASLGRDSLKPGGMLAVECGSGQALQVQDIFKEAGLTKLTITKDLSGIERVVSGQKIPVSAVS